MDSESRQAEEAGPGVRFGQVEMPAVARSLPPVDMLAVSQGDVDRLKRQRELLRDFVRSELVEADFSSDGSGEGDFGIIPGTKKRCLFKQGAEKLQKLFQLGCRARLVDKELDRKGNFAIYTYRAEVYHLASGVTIADCEGSANSQEIKYKERTVWEEKTVKGKKQRESKKVETPVGDVLNTLMKMAQKRAMVGATILATGASEYFTQDVLDEADIRQAQRDQAPVRPKASAPAAQGAAEPEAPVCCGKVMRLSNYADRDTGVRPFWCSACNKKEFPK